MTPEEIFTKLGLDTERTMRAIRKYKGKRGFIEKMFLALKRRMKNEKSFHAKRKI